MPMKIWMTVLALTALLALGGCRRKLDGPRVWWDDQSREYLSDDYQLPEDRRTGTEHDPNRQDLEYYGLM